MGSRYSTRWSGSTARTMVVDQCRLLFEARALVVQLRRRASRARAFIHAVSHCAVS